MSATDDVHRRIEAVWRIEAPQLIVSLARMLRDIGLAEEMAQDALVAALETWPASGLPERPGAGLLTSARRRAIDYRRRDALAARKREQLGYEAGLLQRTDDEVERDDEIGDDLLRLLLTACHPVLSADARVALTVRVLGGPSTREGRRNVVDGPFVEAREMIGGFFLIDVASRAEALAIAAECPAAQWATIEVRQTGACYD